MIEYVVIRLGAEDQPVEWILADSTGTRRSNVASGPLTQAAAEASDSDVIVVVPAVDVLTTTVHMPARSTSKIRIALPFALEEQVADDISDLHFVMGERQENSRLPVAIVARAKMERWIERLAEVGIEPTIMASESQGLAKIQGTLSVLVNGDTVMFNNGADDDFVMQDMKPSDVLMMAGQLGEQENEDGEKSGHLLVFCDAETDTRLSHDWMALRHEMHSVDVNVLAEGVLPKLATTIATGRGINLLQGKYGRTVEYAAFFQPWKIAAILLLGFVLVSVASKGIDYYRLQQELDVLKTQFVAEYQLIRPDDTRQIVDPQGTVDSLKHSMGAATGPQVFLPSLRELGAALAANKDLEIEAITYRAGIIDIRLTVPDVAMLDKIQKAVSLSGRFTATIQSTDQVADKIDGRIRIREVGE
jgi:general secretion pathway protein L